MKAKQIEEMYGITSQKIKDYKKAGVFNSASVASIGKAIDYSTEEVETLVKINILGKAGDNDNLKITNYDHLKFTKNGKF